MPNPACDFSARITALDVTLFNAIPTQSSEGDRRSWLAIQRAVRRPTGYIYLEIGSYLGGSLQQHLLDPWCSRIISIDLRTASQKDRRREVSYYDGNSTERMLDNLRRIAPDSVKKVLCYQGNTGDLDLRAIAETPDFCFIDGDHTHDAVCSDFEFCINVCAPNAVICFHDAWIVHDALAAAVRTLQSRRTPFLARKLDDGTFALFLGDQAAASDPYIQSYSHDGLQWLRERKFSKWIPRLLRPAVKSVRRHFGS